MGFFTFIICILILLLIVIMIGTIQEFTLWVVTRKSHEFVVMIIPALLSLISFGVTLFLTYFILNKFNINTANILFSILMNWEYSFNNFIGMLLGYIACAIVFAILQALCLKLVNINYKKIFDFVKYKILRKKEIKTLAPSEEEQKEKASIDLTHNLLPVVKAKTPFFHYISASLFSFAIAFSSIFGLIYIGILLGEKYII